MLPPQVEQKQQYLMQIRLAVVFGRGDALGVLLFLNWKFVLCKIIHTLCLPEYFSHPTLFAKRSPKSTESPPLHTHPPTHPHHHCTHPLTCSKAAFPQAFPLKGQIFHLCNSVPYWFLEDCSDLLDVQWWPKCSPGREVFSFHSQRFTCIFPRKESVWPNQLSCSLCFLWCYLHMCLCIFYLSIYP